MKTLFCCKFIELYQQVSLIWRCKIQIKTLKNQNVSIYDKVQFAVSNPGQIHLLLNCLYPSALIRSLPGQKEDKFKVKHLSSTMSNESVFRNVRNKIIQLLSKLNFTLHLKGKPQTEVTINPTTNQSQTNFPNSSAPILKPYFNICVSKHIFIDRSLSMELHVSTFN